MLIQAYYVCYKYKLLRGGILDKGPIKVFSGQGSQNHCHKDDWERINKMTFLELAEKWYNFDWKNDPGIDFWQQPDTACTALKHGILNHIEGFDSVENPPTLEEIFSAYKDDPWSVDVKDILRLENPETGRDILRSMVKNGGDPLRVMKAASILAVWGDNSVIDYFQNISVMDYPMTNSNIEHLLFKASLLLLNLPLDEWTLRNRSVFSHLEEDFRECYNSQMNLGADPVNNSV